MQGLIVSLVVVACTVYAAWTLMPAAARRGLATALLRLPLPGRIATRMKRAATMGSGCGCDGCDHAPAKQKAAEGAGATKVVTFHRRIEKAR